MKSSLCFLLVLGLLALSSMAAARSLSAAREATLSGRCFATTDESAMDLPGTSDAEKTAADTALKTLRGKYVSYNQKKSYVSLVCNRECYLDQALFYKLLSCDAVCIVMEKYWQCMSSLQDTRVWLDVLMPVYWTGELTQHPNNRRSVPFTMALI